MANIVVLGAGMVGRAIALDLSQQHQVTAVDCSSDALQKLQLSASVSTIVADVSNKTLLAKHIAPADLIINAVPGHIGFDVLRQVIENGKNIVDIAFYPQDSLTLKKLAMQHNVNVIVDMGVAPGMSHFILGHEDQKMQIKSFQCWVGGLPKTRKWPFQYKAPFSPIDVIEEYTRPARFMRNGNIVTEAALSQRELLDFDYIGTLEAFVTDGLRSLLHTLPHIPNMIEKTLRYPGHIDLILALQSAGFFSEKTIKIDNHPVRPIDMTSQILINEWRLEEGETEFTVMRIICDGNISGKSKRIVYDLYDEYDPSTCISSMARTTGYACTAAANFLLSNKLLQAGIVTPEQLAQEPGCFEYIMSYLKQRNVIYRKSEKQTPGDIN